MKPLQDFVLVRVDEAVKATQSGILIQENWKDLPPTGTVEAVGPKVTDVKAGDRILFARYSALQVSSTRENEEKGLRMIKESHIWAIITDDSVVTRNYAA